MLRTTAGQILVNEALPPELRNYERQLTAKELKEVLRQVAAKYPDKYKEVSKKLMDAGVAASSRTGGYSFGLQDLIDDPDIQKERDNIRQAVAAVLDDDSDPDGAPAKLIKVLQDKQNDFYAKVVEVAKKKGNPLATMVSSGSRGNVNSAAGLMGGHLLYADSNGNPVPIPVLNSYAEGVSPFEYMASFSGARAGLVSVKMATQRAGYLSKQLMQVGHGNTVVNEDETEPDEDNYIRGLPSDINDDDNDGALLATDIGPYKRNTVITKRMREHLRRLGEKDILVRSPMVGGPEDGVYAADVGVRERGALPGVGEVVGAPAAQAIGEPIAQGSLSAKHGGGVAGSNKLISGFRYLIN